MNRIVIFFILWVILGYQTYAQYSEINQAKSYLGEYERYKKLVDIDNANIQGQLAKKHEKFSTNAEANFYVGKIIKLHYDAKAIQNKKNEILESYQYLSRALELNPKLLDKQEALNLIKYLCFDMYNDGIAYSNQNKNQEAYELYKTLIEAKSLLVRNNEKLDVKLANGQVHELKDADIINNYIVMCIKAEKYEDAQKALIQEIAIRPSAAKYVQLIQLCKKTNDTKTAEEYSTKAQQLYPRDIDIMLMTITENMEKKNLNKVIELSHQALLVDSSNIQLYLVLGQTYQDIEKYKEATMVYAQGLKLFPNDYDLNYNMGRAQFNYGTSIYNLHDVKRKPEAAAMLSESKKYFEQCKSINPSRVDIDKIIQDINQIK